MAIQRNADETLLYLIANRELGWRKIGIGFGSRLEKWRRDGWVLEQQVLFDSREDASLAESMLKRKISELTMFAFETREHPGEGHTEMWPYEYGSVDLLKVKEAVDNFTQAMEDAWPIEVVMNFSRDCMRLFVSAIESGEISPDDPSVDEVLKELQLGRDALARSTAEKFVREREPTASRAELEARGLDWKTLMVKRQEYWAVVRASNPEQPADPEEIG